MTEDERKLELFFSRYKETKDLSISLISRSEILRGIIKKEDKSLQSLLIKFYILARMDEYVVNNEDNIRLKILREIGSSVSEEFIEEKDILNISKTLLFKKSLRDFINSKKGFGKVLDEDYFYDAKVMDVSDKDFSLSKFLESFAWRFNFIKHVQNNEKMEKILKKEVDFIIKFSQSKEINESLSTFKNISDLYNNDKFKSFFNYMPELSHINNSNVAFQLIKNIEKSNKPISSDLAFLMLTKVKDNINDFSINIGILKSDLYKKIEKRDVYINNLLKIDEEIYRNNTNSVDVNLKELWKVIYYVVNTSNVDKSFQKDGLHIKYQSLCDKWKEHVDKVFKKDLSEDVEIIGDPIFLLNVFKDVFKTISSDYKLVIQYEINKEEQVIKMYGDDKVKKFIGDIVESICGPTPEFLNFLIDYACFMKDENNKKESVNKIIKEYIEEIGASDKIEDLVMRIDNLSNNVSKVKSNVRKW